MQSSEVRSESSHVQSSEVRFESSHVQSSEVRFESPSPDFSSHSNLPAISFPGSFIYPDKKAPGNEVSHRPPITGLRFVFERNANMAGIAIVVFVFICPIISAKCTDTEIQKYFASSTKPWDNYPRISGAVYPPTKLSSLLIKVRVVFVNDSSPSVNSTDVCHGGGGKAGDLTYKWSTACLYVSGGVSLNTMSFFSLLTIWPQRRETELCLKLPQKCRSDEMDANRRIKSFLSMVSWRITDVHPLQTWPIF